MKPLWITTVVIILLVFILPGLLSLGIRFEQFGHQPSLDRVENIDANNSISQDFISPQNRLTGIALSLKNPLFRNKKDIILTLYNFGNQPIRTATLNGAHIQDGGLVKFMFDPINDSEGKNYLYILSASQVDPKDSLQVFYTVNKQSWVNDVKFNGEDVTGYAVSFAPLYKQASTLALATNIYSGWFGRLMMDTVFLIAYLIILASLSGYLIYSSLGRKLKE